MDITLVAQTGRAQGSAASRRLRREGLVPAVVYGRDLTPLAVAVDHRELMAALATDAGLNAIISLDVEGGDTLTTLAREITRHPYKPRIDHLDFIQISLTEVVEASVGLELTGEPVGVRESGGIIETINTTVLIEALPAEIPSSIELDISDMELNDTMTVADLPVLAGVSYLDPEDTPIVSISIPSALLAEEEEELEEGEEIEGVEGEEGAEESEGESAEGSDSGE